MLRTTTPSVDGKEIRNYLDVVVGEAILGANIFKDIFGFLERKFVDTKLAFFGGFLDVVVRKVWVIF